MGLQSMADCLEGGYSSILRDDTGLSLQPLEDAANDNDNHPPNMSLVVLGLLLHGLFATECVTCAILGFLCGGGVIISVLSTRFECR
jgi:hypothetical protein